MIALQGENAPLASYEEVDEIAQEIDHPTQASGVGTVFPVIPEQPMWDTEEWKALEDRIRQSYLNRERGQE